MAELTLIFFLLALGLFILGAYRRTSPVVFVTMILGVFSLTSALTDPEIGDSLAYLVILDVLIIMMSVVWMIFPRDDTRRRH